MQDGKLKEVSSKMLLDFMHAVVCSIGEDVLGFSGCKMRKHSIRSSAVMAMHQDDVPVYTIMLVEWWSSDAFL
jgi:hypothetical protein